MYDTAIQHDHDNEHADGPTDRTARQRVRHRAAVGPQVAPEHHILREPQRHADRRRAETVVESDACLQQARDQRPDEGAKVDTKVEERETAIASRIALVVQGAQQGRCVGLQRTRAERHQHEADGYPAQTGNHRESDVAAHHRHTAVEHRAFHAEQAVGDPATEHGREIDQPAVGADDARRGALRQFEATICDRVIEVVTEDREHPVEGESLPELHPEQVGQAYRMAKQRAFGWPVLRLSYCCHGGHLPRGQS